MKKRVIIMVLALVVVFGGIFGYDALRGYFIKQFFASYQPPPVTISATKAKAKTWQPFISAVGTLQAVNGVQVSTQVSGVIQKIYFQSGQMVRQGEPLIKIDDSVELAELQNNQAELQLAQENFRRIKKLYNRKVSSKSDFDNAQAKLTQAQAAVAKVKATIAHKNIVAPFSGKIGIREVNVGQFVAAGTKLVSLQQLNPMHLNFSLPEQDLNKLARGQAVQVVVDTYPQHIFPGKITAINSEVDTQTHNILVQATLPNDQNELYPGLFANVEVLLPQQQNVITVPQTAISYSLFGDSIFVIKQHGKDKKGKPILKVSRVYVKVGQQRQDEVAILSGLKAGEEVVTSGQLKLQNNTRVVINNDVKLNYALNNNP